jgi:hypothetical protein
MKWRSGSNHTPGPWSSNHLTSAPLKEWSLKVKKGRRVIAEVPYQDYMTWTNARLIAAAPDLLEALKAAVADWDTEVSRGRWLDAARAAIAKAEGA